MLDKNLLEQISGVFADIDRNIELRYNASAHEQQQDMETLLSEIASTHPLVSAVPSGETGDRPRFSLGYPNGGTVGINFTGLPLGHELSSLILAILYSAGLGKQPDAAMISRIKRLKANGAKLRTFISLSCENCPDVVQALSLMASHHDGISHEMIDGGVWPEEIDRLGIQGVPAVYIGDKMISSGKASFAQLLERLEDALGSTETTAQDLGEYDVTVIGAGPAGAAAAIYAARKGLKTAIIADRIGGQMQDTKGIENFISLPYIEGDQLSDRLAKHIAEYDIDLLSDRRVTEVDWQDARRLTFSSKEQLSTKALILATGANWRKLAIPGEDEYLGRGVAFCPHCDGPFYKGKDIAVIGGGNSGVEAAIDLAGIAKSVTVLEFADTLKADEVLVAKMSSLTNVTAITNAKTTEIVGDGNAVTALRYEDRETGQPKELPLAGVFVQIGLTPNSGLVKDLVATNRFGEIEVDSHGRTDQPGIYAAGDVTTVPYKQIVVAMGEGAKAGLAAFEDIALRA